MAESRADRRDELHPHAQGHAEQHGAGHGQEQVELEDTCQQEADKGPGHEDLAVGEIDQGDDAVDHGVAQGDQGVGAAQGHTVYQLLQEHCVSPS